MRKVKATKKSYVPNPVFVKNQEYKDSVEVEHPYDSEKKVRTNIANVWRTMEVSGAFHCWMQYGEGGDYYPMALIEDELGEMHEIQVNDIQFVKGEENDK